MKESENIMKLTIPENQMWENLKISNDFMFAKVMRNPEICKGMLERLLDIVIDYIEYPEEQKTIDIAKDSKSVRLDVYLKDEKGTIYNVEIQTTNGKNLPERTRYYQDMIDLNAIEKGTDYKQLPNSFVIFICTFDAFGEGRFKYTFENICRENKKLLLNDRTYKIFFNTTGTKGKIGKDAKNILQFIESNTTEDDFTEKLAQEIQKIKENKEWKVEYMTLLMREREKYNEGMAKGIEKGIEKGIAEGIEKGIEMGIAEGIEKGIEKGRAEGIEMGRAEGIEKGVKGIIEFASELNYSNDTILSVLRKKFGINTEQAKEYLNRYYKKNI